MLYNILLLINQYNGSITKTVIAKTTNILGISHGYFIRLWLFHQIMVISSDHSLDTLEISNPHEYAYVSY